MTRTGKPSHRLLTCVRLAALLLIVSAGAALAQAVTRPAPAPATALRSGPGWNELSGAQRSALAPLQRDWPAIDAERKQKWLEVAARLPNMPAEERARMQGRMSEWARMTPQERGQARLGYQQAQRLAPQEREARWEAYQALSADQRRQLATRSPPNGEAARSAESRAARNDRQAKPNIVANPAYAPAPKQVAPSVVQAQPGASTTLMSKRPTPPAHQQTGLPKIAAQPGFVDRTTLLPQRGAQAAATRSGKGAPESGDRASQR